jgi:hypothetical protein
VGGALYNNRWHRDAQRFVRRHSRELGALPVWLFSSGPLGDAEQQSDIPPVRGVARLMHRIGARGHETFGGRLLPDPPGFLAPAMVKTWAGDWRATTRLNAGSRRSRPSWRQRPAGRSTAPKVRCHTPHEGDPRNGAGPRRCGKGGRPARGRLPRVSAIPSQPAEPARLEHQAVRGERDDGAVNGVAGLDESGDLLEVTALEC